MTKKKITELIELTTADNSDLLHIVDTSEPIVSNQNKKISVLNLLDGLSGTESPLTTKGDIYTHTGASDTRLEIGSNGQVLTANPNTITGLEWAEVQGGRLRLTEDTTFYVDKATGSNTNSGLTLNDKWQTITYAFDYIASIDLNNYNVTLEIEYGNYVDEGVLYLPLLVGAKTQTDFSLGAGPSPGPGGPPINSSDIYSHLDIGPIGFKDGALGKGALTLPPLEANHFGYYSINNATIQIDGLEIETLDGGFGQGPNF